MNKLFDDNDESDTDLPLKTNKEYARTFEQNKNREMLQKFKSQKPNETDSDDSGSDNTDDDEPVNPEFSQKFFKTLALLKSNDPKIYDKNINFFSTENKEQDKPKKNKKYKPLNIDQYETDVLFATEGKMEDSEDEMNYVRPESPTVAEEQNIIRIELKSVLKDDTESDDDNFGGLFKKREKPREEEAKEEKEYNKWLAGQPSDIAGTDAKSLVPLREFWSDPKLSKDETFLRDYILNNGYVDNDDEEYLNDLKQLSDDEKDIENQEEFEQKYNFRYEEPDNEFLKRYPRTIEKSVRKVDNKRSKKRLETKVRKENEKEQKLRELQIIKQIKKQEIQEKIAKLKEVTGNEQLAFENANLDDDFDPDEHDRKMKELFDDEYYHIDEEVKPECPDIEELKIDDWDNYKPENDNYQETEYYSDNEQHCEDDKFNMDCDYVSTDDKRKATQKEIIEKSTMGKRKRRRRSKFAEHIKKEKPIFDPEDEKNFEEYIDEYYKLDYEDMIGDIPCRFKYVETVPNDFGLSVEEIFLAKNSELNQWASLKKAVQIRPDHVEKNEVFVFKNRANNLDLKKKIFRSLYGEPSEDEEEDKELELVESVNVKSDVQEKKKKKKKKSKNIETEIETDNKLEDCNTNIEQKTVVVSDIKSEKKKKKRKKLSAENLTNDLISNEEQKQVEENEILPVSCVNVQDSISKKIKKSKSPKSEKEDSNLTEVEKNDSVEIVKSKTKKRKIKDVEKDLTEVKKIKLENNQTNIKLPDSHNNKHKKHNKLKEHQKSWEINNNRKHIMKNFKIKNKDMKEISDNRLRAFGIQPSKFHYLEKLKNKSTNNKKNFKTY